MAISGKKYVFAFFITGAIFATALYVSNTFNQKKLDEVRAVEDSLSLNILSSETQSALLQETSCKDVNNTFLSHELGDLGDKLSYAASQNSPDNTDIANLKQYYSLLEIKDYLLMKNVTAKCGLKPTFLLYFYSNKTNCPDCEKAGYVLDALHEKYPTMRVYSFDYNSEEPAVKTLISIYHIDDNLPALIVNSDPYYGFRTLEDLETNIPAITRLKATLPKPGTASTTATSTSTH
jgi:thiol-disulfide isomerase/thioredoxin